jgi:hypothetical protein
LISANYHAANLSVFLNTTLTPPATPTAIGTVILSYGFAVKVMVNYGGSGYTNVPSVRLVGGGGIGATAVAVESNGVVTAINITSTGSGYTNAPLVVIDPPYVLNPVLGIAPLSLLSFSDLTVGGSYQLQQFGSRHWANLSTSFTASNSVYTQMVAGVVSPANYRLASSPVPVPATATPVVSYGYVVYATLTSGGSGYLTSPAVTITGGAGSGATAITQISGGGVVTNISIINTGSGYTGTPTIQIAPPPVPAVTPTVFPVMRLDAAILAPYDNYQVQFTPSLGNPWGNWNSGLFTPTATTNSQFLFITNTAGFFRVEYAQ